MSFRTAVLGQRVGPRVVLGAAGLILLTVTAGGCVLGNDNDRPVLAVDPLWDVSPTDAFSGGGCNAADVVFMTWAIENSRGRTLEEVTKLEDCKPLDFFGLLPGTYRVQLTGYDRNENPRWNTTCTDLVLGRFDVLYECRVDQVEPEDVEPPQDEEDAGVADAG